MTREEILSIEEYCAEHKHRTESAWKNLIYPFGTFIRRRKSIEKMMKSIPSRESSSNYHPVNMFLRQCHLLALPENPVSRSSVSRKRTRGKHPKSIANSYYNINPISLLH